MLVLGLDPSLRNYGWCLYDSEKTPPIVDRGRFQTNSKTLFIKRYIDIREWLHQLCMSYSGLKVVGIESPPFGDLWSEGLYGLFLFSMEALYRTHKNVYFWAPTTIKSRAKEILGRTTGQMFKIDMIEAAKKESGVNNKWNSDTADAFNVAFLTYRFMQYVGGEIGDSDLTDKEKWIFLGIKNVKGKVKKRGMIYRENDRFFQFGDE